MDRSTTLRPISAMLQVPLALLACAATVSLASAMPSPPPKQQQPSSGMPASSQPAAADDDSAAIKAARAEAEKLYTKGYELSEEAKALDKAGKPGDAKKKYGKALKQFEGAVERDPNYYQAWNMVGFCSRHSGDLKKAFASYEKCLAIAPDYEEAHEYLGEAYLQAGDIANAKMQLAWLHARGSDEAEELEEAIEKAAPDSSNAH
ncbi:MAG: tetratricopeptide repeat protein [Candidatus Eiseniibacteriota bacterium]